jgi:hypothetical protein
MSGVRRWLAVASVLLLVLGYGASQWAALQGSAHTYTVAVDTPGVRLLALALLLAAVAFALRKDPGVETDG